MSNSEDLERVKQKYIEQLETDHRYSISKFDEQALYISSGALALSLTFAKDIVPIKDANFIWMYFIALVLFALVILISFVSHYKSSRLIEERMRSVDSDNFNVPEDKIIPRLNLIIAVSLPLGIFALVAFSIINVYIYQSFPTGDRIEFIKNSKNGDKIEIKGDGWELTKENTGSDVIKLKRKKK